MQYSMLMCVIQNNKALSLNDRESCETYQLIEDKCNERRE